MEEPGVVLRLMGSGEVVRRSSPVGDWARAGRERTNMAKNMVIVILDNNFFIF
jgi:hypothetical protein